MNNNINLRDIILEDGYNTDYIYSLIIAIFYMPTDGTNKMINIDSNNGNTYYVQEYIKNKFIYPLHHNQSIESHVVNKLRMFLYNCGWLYKTDQHILSKPSINIFYDFLICELFSYNFTIIRICSIDNTTRAETNEKHVNMITLTHTHISKVQKNNPNKILSLSLLINNWVDTNIIEEKYDFRFDSVPMILPIYLDIRDEKTNINTHYIDIMEGVNFCNVNDKIQKMLIWDLHSIICQNNLGEYYTITLDQNKNMIAYSDKNIPSKWLINNSDVDVVKKVMQEVRLVFYKL